MIDEHLYVQGYIKIYRLPDEWSEEEYHYWWLPLIDNTGLVLRPARMSREDKEHWLIAKGSNLITNAGRSQVLTYIGGPSGSTTQWAQYLAFGTGAITFVSPTDTSLANETYRVAQTSNSVSGTQVDINFQVGTSPSINMTNVGIFGNGAIGTLGSGTLLTHALFSFNKGAFAIAVDYIINLL